MGLLQKNPVTKAVKCKSFVETESRKALTREEQKLLEKQFEQSEYGLQFAFILQTGLRIGELSGLMWSDVDEKSRVIKIRRTGGYQQTGAGWQVGDPKSKAGRREIPLTKKAERILQQQKEKVEEIKGIPKEFSNYVFLNGRGKPIHINNYDKGLHRACKAAGVREISVHVLRHTFATRCA